MSFDDQASAYEERAGLPDAICREVARDLLDGLAANAVVLDVGAGTGTIGRYLAGGAVRYLGLDVSRPMLAEFSRGAKLERALLVQADADRRWPLADRSADVILFSRSAHLLRSERTLDEVLRIAAPGARVWIGRMRRPRESAAEQLKRAMQRMLRDRNVPGRNGERAKRDFLDALAQRGAQHLGERMSSSFIEDEAPIESLQSWASKEGLAGRTVSDEIKREVLGELERWAKSEFGDLSIKRSVARHYELEGVQLVE